MLIKTSTEFQPAVQYLIPPEYLRNLTNRAPFIIIRTPSPHFVHVGDEGALALNTGGPLSRDHANLPSDAVLYMRAHGHWTSSIMDIVSAAHQSRQTLEAFLDRMTRSFSMPLAEASFLWHLLQSQSVAVATVDQTVDVTTVDQTEDATT